VLEILAKIPTLNLFSREQLKNMVKSSRVRKFACGDVIIREGDQGRDVYFLLEGCISVFAGNVKINAIKRAGDVFGEMGVITEEPRSVTLIAQSECLCLSIDAERVFTGDPGKNLVYHSILYRSFAEVLARRLRKMNEEIKYLRRELALAQSRGRGAR
jgi:CRP-like cAMP-binding protein